jgi:hypothetical protein
MGWDGKALCCSLFTALRVCVRVMVYHSREMLGGRRGGDDGECIENVTALKSWESDKLVYFEKCDQVCLPTRKSILYSRYTQVQLGRGRGVGLSPASSPDN